MLPVGIAFHTGAQQLVVAPSQGVALAWAPVDHGLGGLLGHGWCVFVAEGLVVGMKRLTLVFVQLGLTAVPYFGSPALLSAYRMVCC